MSSNRLYSLNLMKEYPDLGERVYYKTITGKRPLLQKDYGKPLDCTLTSLAFIFGKEHYDEIERIAYKYGYDGDRIGTNPFTIKLVMKQCLGKFKMEGSAHSRYLKGLGWSFSLVKELINKGSYVVLNLWSDGRDYYKDHTVTIIGVSEYENARFLVVYDNWNSSISYIDYRKLSIISSINWFEGDRE